MVRVFDRGVLWLSSEIILSWAYQTPGDGRSTVRNELFMVHIQSGNFKHQLISNPYSLFHFRKTRTISIRNQSRRISY